MTNAEARFNNSLRPQKPEGLLGWTAQDGHLDSHTAPELWNRPMMMMKWCLMSSDVIWRIRDKLWPMPMHGSIIPYVHGNHSSGNRLAQCTGFNTLDNWGHKTPTQSKRKRTGKKRLKGHGPEHVYNTLGYIYTDLPGNKSTSLSRCFPSG